MADEAVLIFETDLPIPFTVANATGIEKGAVLKQTDPMTAIINSAVDNVPAGIAAEEKIASDGRTKLAVYRGGIFKVVASGTITVGDACAIAGAVNRVYSPNPTTKPALNIGKALETASDGESFLMELNIGTGGAQVS